MTRLHPNRDALFLPNGEWISDRARSTIGFSIEDVRGEPVRARFERFAARLTVTSDAGATLVGTAFAASIATRNARLATVLTSPFVFDAQRHPELRFESGAIHRLGAHVELDGRLTIRRCTLAVAAVGTLDDAHAERHGFVRLELETRVDRRQFGFDWPAQRRPAHRAATELEIRADLALRRA